MIFTVRQDPAKLNCSACGARQVSPKGQVWRQFHCLPIGLKPVWVVLAIRRVYCLAWGLVRQAKISFADPRRTYAKGKEDLRRLRTLANKQLAETFLFNGAGRAWTSGIHMLSKFADTLTAHRASLLAYYDFPISTGLLEGTNNKIKTLKRQAYGFRGMDFFKLKIMAIHETRYALVG